MLRRRAIARSDPRHLDAALSVTDFPEGLGLRGPSWLWSDLVSLLLSQARRSYAHLSAAHFKQHGNWRQALCLTSRGDGSLWSTVNGREGPRDQLQAARWPGGCI